MRYATWLGSLLLLATISTAQRPGSNGILVVAKCSDGLVVVTATGPWHTNANAPWAWDKGSLVSKDSKVVKFKGPKCEGQIKAYIANGDQVKGPIVTPVK